MLSPSSFRRIHKNLLLILSLAAALTALSAGPESPAPEAASPADPTLFPGWSLPPNTVKPWTRWWWPGSAVDPENLTRQLEAMAAAGLGGVEITPIYGARGYEDRYIDFLSTEWMEMLLHTSREARRLGLQVDMATGTGWPFGGPWVDEADAAQKLVLDGDSLSLEPTGQMVKRAAPGGEGRVLDPYSVEGLQRYLGRFEEAFAGYPDGLVRSQFHDSFEYYGASGTPDLEKVFAQMHGYELADWADVLLDQRKAEPETTARLKADYRAALDQLHQRYLGAWTDWAHSRGWMTRNQSHGAPANLLDLYAIADIPETEIFGSTPFPIPGLRRDTDAIRSDQDLPEPLVSQMASSAAHVMGKPLVSCETATWLRDHWKVTLAHMKPELDRIFLDGINHVFYHGTVYSPADAPWPGWLFYASTQFNPNNPWWQDFGALNTYVARVQSVLQGGKPGNDVLVYWPVHDIWHDSEGLMKQLTVHDVGFVLDMPFGRTARRLKAAGHAFDYVSDAQLAASEAAGGQIRTPGNVYATVVVPPTGHMPLDSLDALLRLAAGGADVIFEELPTDVPGLTNLEERNRALQARLASLPFAKDTTSGRSVAKIGKGRVFLGDPVGALASLDTVQPEPMAAEGLDYIRRRSAAGWDYFIANLGAEPVDSVVALGTQATGAAFLDPLSGRGGTIDRGSTPDGAPAVRIQLDPGESVILRTLESLPSRGPAWAYREKVGPAIPVDGPWSVSFVQGGPELPASFEAPTAGPWTGRGDAEADRFAGTARYATSFVLPKREAGDWLLELGDVRESARVYINDRYAGTAWSLPFRLRVGDFLQPGNNFLIIEVTNTAANRIRDMDRRRVDWKIMHEINFVNIHYRPFDASEWQIQPSGLLGPVRLQPLK